MYTHTYVLQLSVLTAPAVAGLTGGCCWGGTRRSSSAARRSRPSGRSGCLQAGLAQGSSSGPCKLPAASQQDPQPPGTLLRGRCGSAFNQCSLFYIIILMLYRHIYIHFLHYVLSHICTRQDDCTSSVTSISLKACIAAFWLDSGISSLLAHRRSEETKRGLAACKAFPMTPTTWKISTA